MFLMKASNHADLVLEDECVLSISGDDAVGLFKGEGSIDDVLFATDSIPIDCIGTPTMTPVQVGKCLAKRLIQRV